MDKIFSSTVPSIKSTLAHASQSNSLAPDPEFSSGYITINRQLPSRAPGL